MINEAELKLDQLRRQARILSLLSAAKTAGLEPLPLRQLHSFAYLANALSPVWSMPPLDARVLKLRNGPYYPDLQDDIDSLIGRSIILISDIEYIVDEDRDGRRISAKLELSDAAPRVLQVLWSFADERNLQTFVDELALAMAGLSTDELDQAVSEDATYGNRFISFDDVVDFAEYRDRNYSANAASFLGSLTAAGSTVTAGEKLHLYVHHLRKRLQRAQ